MKELTNALKTKKVVFGTDKTLKLLRNDKLKTVFVASNCDEKVKEKIKHYAEINKTDVIELDMKNNEVGLFCKKPFFVSVLSLQK